MDGGVMELNVYRGEITSPEINHIQSKMKAIYFANADTASIYASGSLGGGCPRVYPVTVVLNNPFVYQPKNAFLELEDVAAKLGVAEATRIALKFEEYIRHTDNWTYRINESNDYRDVEHYLLEGGRIEDLYFDAYRFFADTEEVSNLIALGYDGASHQGNGLGSALKPEVCVFSLDQIKYLS